MRVTHLERLRPVCPVCRKGGEGEFGLELAQNAREEKGHILEGALHCSNPKCLREYPIIDGIPLLVSNIREYVSQNILSIYARRDLSEFMESILGDCCGPNSALDVSRQHLSSYVWDHFGEFDTEGMPDGAAPGGVASSLRRALEMAAPIPSGPAIDLGCSVGRSAWELAARSEQLVLGVDLHFPMLRVAGEVLRQGRVKYPRRRNGLVYDWRDFRVPIERAEQVDFWAADATALPFPKETFALAVGLNVLDCVGNPRDLLVSIGQVLSLGGKTALTCPYDWSPGATPVEAWLGGHSQRSKTGGSPEALLRGLLGEPEHAAAVRGLKLVAEQSRLPWEVRLHERSTMRYETHLVVAEKVA